jgi:hypothetical protein
LPLVASLLEAASGNTQPQQCIQLEKIMSYLNLHALPHYGFHQADNGPRPDNAEYLWSGKLAPPAVGEKIEITMNGIGEATVTGYFAEEGWLGVRFRAHNPPEWYVKQNGRDCIGHAFGVEIASMDQVAERKAARDLYIAGKVADNTTIINELVRRAEFCKLMAKLYAAGRAGDKSWTCVVAENVLDTIDENHDTCNPNYDTLKSWFLVTYVNPRDARKAKAIVARFEKRFPA